MNLFGKIGIERSVEQSKGIQTPTFHHLLSHSLQINNEYHTRLFTLQPTNDVA